MALNMRRAVPGYWSGLCTSCYSNGQGWEPQAVAPSSHLQKTVDNGVDSFTLHTHPVFNLSYLHTIFS